MENTNVSAAISKLTDELAAFKGNRYGEVVKDAVAEALMDFCNKSDAFASIVAASKRTLSDCVKEIMEGCGVAISDIEAYRRAVQFYCPEANVSFDMVIELPGSTDAAASDMSTSDEPKSINIFDIL